MGVEDLVGVEPACSAPGPVSGRTDSDPILRTEKVGKSFGGLVALEDASIRAHLGQVTGIMGPNGAGKTTLFNVITGNLGATTGRVFVKGHDASRFSPYRIARLGVARTFQSPRVFPSLRVVDNVILGRYPLAGEKALSALFGRVRVAKRERAAREEALEALGSVGLLDCADELACNLGYAQRKIIEIARGVMQDAELFLLDEPFSGIHGEVVSRMEGIICGLRERGAAVCLIEHNVGALTRLADYVYVLNEGRLIAEGTSREIRTNPMVIEAYLGKERARVLAAGDH